jgi:hypothetical protein
VAVQGRDAVQHGRAAAQEGERRWLSCSRTSRGSSSTNRMQ